MEMFVFSITLSEGKYTRYNQMAQSNCIWIIIQFYVALYKFVKYINVYISRVIYSKIVAATGEKLLILPRGKASYFATYQEMDHNTGIIKRKFPFAFAVLRNELCLDEKTFTRIFSIDFSVACASAICASAQGLNSVHHNLRSLFRVFRSGTTT